MNLPYELSLGWRYTRAGRATRKIGTPVFTAFKLTRPRAKDHEQAKLLPTPGHEVSLDYCSSYN